MVQRQWGGGRQKCIFFQENCWEMSNNVLYSRPSVSSGSLDCLFLAKQAGSGAGSHGVSEV